MTMVSQITENDFPALYQASNKAAINSQKLLMKILFFNLLFLTLGSFSEHMRIDASIGSGRSNIIGAILLLLAFLTSLALAFSEFDRSWYGARAIAESVKTLSWHYMMGTETFPLSGHQNKVEENFTARLRSLLLEKKHLAWKFDADDGTKPQITEVMRKIRLMQFDQRKKLYLSSRIADQRQWYSSKAKFNQRRAHLMFALVILAQLVAFIFAFLTIEKENIVNLSSPMATLSASFFSWLQIKKHRELSEAYGVTAQELGLVAEEASYVNSDNDLSRFVEDSERAISREHTMWIARREKG